MRINRYINYILGLFFSLFLCMSTANAVRYAGSCIFDVEGHPANAQEKKSGHAPFLWVYNPAWPNEQMRTTLGNTNVFEMDDHFDLDHLVIGTVGTAAEPLRTIAIHEGKMFVTIDPGLGAAHIVTKIGHDCKHWQCTNHNDHNCLEPHQ
ncbi:MAG: hypothetical protein K0R94_1664 [Burkholderiales bacterium]|jgi:hypothetical protein|nr:hypothetical protein [Burkholderiales bacterium]